MKRKRSPELAVVESRKKASPRLRKDETVPCPFVQIIQQYGLLASIASSLSPKDLLALALSSKTVHHAIFPRPCSLVNLLGKMSCPGRGIRIRQRQHKKTDFFNPCGSSEYVQCGTTSGKVESRPCISCKVTTCDECRIHCVYQSNYEDPGDPEELPCFSGFVLLSPPMIPILSPHHLSLDVQPPGPRWQNPSNGEVGPYHDQGFIDVPFDSDTFGPPEFVEDILDLDLGRHSLALSLSSNVPDPSPVLQAFYDVTEHRKRWFCDTCLPPVLLECPEVDQAKICRCTLRDRFLDRWLCLQCYEAEEATISKSYPKNLGHCGCGRGSDRIVCLWCNGVVLEEEAPEATDPDNPTSIAGSP